MKTANKEKAINKFSNLIVILLVLAIVLMANFLASSQKNAKAQSGDNRYFGFAGSTDPPDDFDKIIEAGAGYIRKAVGWHYIETSDDTFYFNGLDGSYDYYKNLNLGFVPRLTTRESWATYCDTTNLTCPDNFDTCPKSSADCPPKDLGDWNANYGYSALLYDFVYKTLEHMNSTNRPVEYIIVGNEANTLLFWHGTSEDYFKTRGTVYKAVKDINSQYGAETKVLDNGFAGEVWGYALIRDEACSGDPERMAYAEDFIYRYFSRKYTQEQIQDFIDNNILDLENFCANPERSQIILRDAFKVDPNMGEASFDYMAYHFYEPWNTQEEIIDWIKNEMGNNGYQKPIIHTEGGYYDKLRLFTDPAVEGELRQDVANDIPKLHVIAFANEVEKWLWLPFTERPTAEYYGAEWNGLISSTLQELPAFTSYKVMTGKLDGFSAVEKISDQPYVYKFTVGSSPVYVLWNDSPITYDLSSEMPGAVEVTRVDNSSEVIYSSSLEIGPSPIYVEMTEILLSKAVDKMTVYPGGTLTYTISYSNNAQSQLNNARIEDAVPAGTSFLSADNGGIYDGNRVTWNLGIIPLGGSGSVGFQVKIE